MHLEQYDYYADDSFKIYEFYSKGPSGSIKKVVLFTKVYNNPVVYNLAFGDEDPQSGQISDTVISDNKDKEKILATVANTINDFCDHFGNHFIYASGSTPARTRLYQISISNLLDEISVQFDVYGIKNDIPYKFQKNVNYEGFLVKRK
jgi:hypothetical protein